MESLCMLKRSLPFSRISSYLCKSSTEESFIVEKKHNLPDSPQLPANILDADSCILTRIL